jgi:hypothetical protein
MKHIALLSTLLTLSASSLLYGELLEKELSPAVKMQYQEMQLVGDAARQEIVIKNPHFYLRDDSDKVVAELDLKGNLNILSNYKENHFEIVSDGSLHVLTTSDFSDEDQPMDATVDGKLIGSIDIDYAKAKDSLAALKSGELTEQGFLTLLEATKEAFSEGSNLKIVDNEDPRLRNTPVVLEKVKVGYRLVPGSTPEEFTLNIKAKQDSSLVGYGATFGFPEAKKIDSDIEFKVLLPEWKKLIPYVRTSGPKTLPEGVVELKINAKSFMGEGVWDSTIGTKHSEDNRTTIDSKAHYTSQIVANWVELIQKLKKEDFSGSTKNNNPIYGVIEKTLYHWLISPKTTRFLSLLPLQYTLDWNGSMTYVEIPKFTVDKGNFDFSLLGKEKLGIMMVTDYQKEEFKSVLTFVGGRPTIDYGLDLYNSFSDSITEHWKLPKFSDAAKEALSQILSKYTDQSDKASKDMKFPIGYSKEGGVTIGNKPISDFQAEIIIFSDKFLGKAPDLQSISIR